MAWRGNDLGGPDFLTGPPNFDAVAEVKVLINSFQAEYGRSAGAMINVVTKSGTKDYRGSGYWYKRHEMWNATPFFNNALDLEKPRYRYSTIGATLGGPVPLKPFRDDMFFFYGYEHLRIREPQPVRRVSMPTALERQGDFSQSFDQAGNLIVVRDPSTGLPFPGNRIPADRLNANGRALLDFFPLPNRTDRAQTNGEYNYLFQESIDRPRNRHDGRVDHRLSDRDSYYVRFGWSKQDHQGFAVPAGSSNWGLVAQHYLQVDRTITGTYTRLIGSNTVNEASIGVRYNTEDGSPLTDEGVQRITRDTVGFRVPQFYPQNNPLNVIPYLTFGGGVVPNVVSVNYESRFPLNGCRHLADVQQRAHYDARHAHVEGRPLRRVGPQHRRPPRHVPRIFSFNRDVNNPLDSNHPFANALLGNFTLVFRVDDAQRRRWHGGHDPMVRAGHVARHAPLDRRLRPAFRDVFATGTRVSGRRPSGPNATIPRARRASTCRGSSTIAASPLIPSPARSVPPSSSAPSCPGRGTRPTAWCSIRIRAIRKASAKRRDCSCSRVSASASIRSATAAPPCARRLACFTKWCSAASRRGKR